MKVLIVCSGTKGNLSPFIKDQIDALSKLGIDLSLFQIKKRGLLGYLLHLKALRRTIKQVRPDLIHAHFGLSGLLANMQFTVPVVTTFHGCDINNVRLLKYSKWADKLSEASIFVEEGMLQKVRKHEKHVIIPCGVVTSVFYPVSKPEASRKIGINLDNINIVFSSAFTSIVKNPQLAKKSCDKAEIMIRCKINLIELKGYTRDQVNLLMNASDCVLLTSFSEGSPQLIKEAMACNCPIVATNVGDIKWLLGNTAGCFITNFSTEDVAEKIKKALEFGRKTNGRDRIIELGLDSETTAKKIIKVYQKVLNK